MSEEKIAKYVVGMVKIVLDKLHNDGCVSVEFLIKLEKETFNTLVNDTSYDNRLTEWLIEEWKDNSFFTYNPEDNCFYPKKTKM